MSQLEKSMETIVDVFHKYARKEGDQQTLNQKEFKQLVEKEMPNILKKEKMDDKAINHMMENMDADKDYELCFEEFVKLLVKILILKDNKTHKNVSTHGHSRGRGRGSGCGPSHQPSLREADYGSCDTM